MAWFTHGPRSPTVSRPARWIIHTDGLVACPGSCRRYRTAPLRLSHVRPPALTRSGSLPGCAEVAGMGRDAGLRVCRPASPRRRALPDCWAGHAHQTAARGCAPTSGSPRARRPAGLPAQSRWSRPALPSGNGSRACARGQSGGASAALVTGRAGGRATRSGGDRQCHQPFELADFLAKAAHVWAVGRIQPMAAARVRCPGRLVPTLSHPGAPSRATPGPFRPEPTKRPDLTDRRTKSERAGTTFEAEQWVGRRRRSGGALAVMTGNN